MALFRRIGLALATGYIWFFFGERIFWPFLGEGGGPHSLMATWLVYSLFAYACLICISEFKVKKVAAIFLIGALFGWLVEGLFSMTMFGLSGVPFPLSIVWTGLAWHAMSITLGWYYLREALARSAIVTLVASVILGFVWGFWSLSWPLQDLDISPNSYLIYGLVCTTLFILAFHMSSWLKAGEFRASEGEKIFVAIVAGSYYALVTVRTFPLLALTTLPILFSLIFWALWQNKKIEEKAMRKDSTNTSILSLFGEKLLWRRSLLLFVAPCVASVVFASGHYVASNTLFLIMLVPVSIVLFVASIIKITRLANV